MVFSYKTVDNRPIAISIGDSRYELHSEEKISCDNKDTVRGCIEIEKQKELIAINYLGMLAKRLVANIINIIIMNFPSKWFEGIDPFVFHGDISVGTSDMEIEYKPAVFNDDGLIREKPKLLVNGQEEEVELETDREHIKVGFIRYCFDLVSFWTYGALIIVIVFVLSGRLKKYIFVVLLYLLLTAFLFCKKIRKSYKEKQLMSESLLNLDWIKKG